MKKIILLILMVSSMNLALSQNRILDSLDLQLQNFNREDSNRVLTLFSLADYYGFLQFDSCLLYAEETIKLSQKIDYPYGIYLGYMATFHGLNSQGNYAKALQAVLNFQDAAEKIKRERPWAMSQVYYFLGLLNREMSNYNEAKSQFQKSIVWQKTVKGPQKEVFASYSQMGIVYMLLNQPDSALYYTQKGYEFGLFNNRFDKYFPLAIGALGNVNMTISNFKDAEKYYKEAIVQSALNNNVYFQTRNYNNLAALFDKINLQDSAIYYAKLSLQLCQQHKFGEFSYDASKILTKIYGSRNNSDSTLKYMRIMTAAKDSVFNMSNGQQFQQFAFSEIQRLQKDAAQKEKLQTMARLYTLVIALIILLLLSFSLYKNSTRKQRDKIEIQKAYNELKSTQTQLIQSEKMASLGELTAGIAHEIQNPLNFVNNFSEVNKELLVEMKDEMNKGNLADANEIANDVIANEEKINHHGKRADAIVKGMLQHSQSSSGKKEPTDINALCDEYLRLSYRGLRAKDKSFNATIKTDFDAPLEKINIIPQDIGRVLLNLYNNAFYAVAEKMKINLDNYEPTVSISTKKLNDEVQIIVKDNGNGIPQNIVDKIFQPFFTTKPTGQGTGLGLSLSYDIIKAHGGEIKVESKEGEGSTFIILIPAN
jgi:two-component system NtrC family sensor kinase